MLCMDLDGVDGEALEDGLMDTGPITIGVVPIGVDLALVLGVHMDMDMDGKPKQKIKAFSIEIC